MTHQAGLPVDGQSSVTLLAISLTPILDQEHDRAPLKHHYFKILLAVDATGKVRHNRSRLRIRRICNQLSTGDVTGRKVYNRSTVALWLVCTGPRRRCSMPMAVRVVNVNL